jgi:hypothetical protein
MIEKDKMFPGMDAAKQAGPTEGKTLGDVIREALERANKERSGTATVGGTSEPEQCNCIGCQERRAKAGINQAAVPMPDDADLKIGSTVLNAKGNHITALFEEEGDTAVISLKGRGVDFVATTSGEQGIRFNSPEALQEFFEFVTHVEVM